MKKLVLLALLSLPVLSVADTSQQKIIQFKISSLQLFSSFSSFMYFHGDDRNRNRLLQAQSRGDQAILALASSNNELLNKWNQISEYTKLYQEQNSNESDMSLEAGWSILQGELATIVKTLEKGSSDTNSLSKQSDIISVQVRMEMILSRYMAYANSTTGGYGVSYGEIPLEKQIADVSERLAQLVKVDSKYGSIMKQWKYIQGTLLAYNSNVAPFVVLHTFDKMRKLIAAE